MSTSTLTVKRNNAFSIVDDRLITDGRLGLDTRLIVGWMLGRPDGWVLHISHVQRTFGIGDRQWKRMRKEMTKFGYFRSTKHRAADGSFTWVNVVDEAAIPARCRDGETTPGTGMDGAGMGAEGGDISDEGEQKDVSSNTEQKEGSSNTEQPAAARSKKRRGNEEVRHGVVVWTPSDAASVDALVERYGADLVAEVAATCPVQAGQPAPYVSAVAAALATLAAARAREARTQEALAKIDAPVASPEAARAHIAAAQAAIGRQV